VTEQEGTWLDDGRTFIPKDVMDEAMARAEGKTVPLKDRPGGEVIGTAKIVKGQCQITVTDPEAKKVVDEMLRFPLTGFSIGMVDPPKFEKTPEGEQNG